MPELATSLEVVINDVNDELAEEGETAEPVGQKEAAETEAPRPRATRAMARTGTPAAAEKGGKGKGKGGRDLTLLPEGTAGAEIVRAENMWLAAARTTRAPRRRAIKGILNKITPEKFDRLMEQLLECGIDDADTLGGLSHRLRQGHQEPGFCSMYADVCLRLSRSSRVPRGRRR